MPGRGGDSDHNGKDTHGKGHYIRISRAPLSPTFGATKMRAHTKLEKISMHTFDNFLFQARVL